MQYTPNQVKDAVAGWGGAGKEQVQKMVQIRLGLAALPKPADAADAAALALCHLAFAPMRRRVAAARRAGSRPMIGSLRGQVLERGLDGTVLLEVGGVGYLVTVTPRTLAELEPTIAAFLYVHHHIREDAQTLFGFLHRDERATFEVLIATHGIGPSLALAILGTHSPTALVDIVANGDLGVAHAGARRRQEDRRAAARRAAQPAQPADARPGQRRSAAAAASVGRRRPRGAGRARLRHRRDPRRAARAARRQRRRRRCCATRSSCWGPSVRDEFLDPRSPAPTTSSRPTRPGCGHGASPSSSASAS